MSGNPDHTSNGKDFENFMTPQNLERIHTLPYYYRDSPHSVTFSGFLPHQPDLQPGLHSEVVPQTQPELLKRGNAEEANSSASVSHGSQRPGRRGAWLCKRCRKLKQGKRAPCVPVPGNEYGACAPCVKAGLSAQCGGATLPPGRRDEQEYAKQLQSRNTGPQLVPADPTEADQSILAKSIIAMQGKNCAGPATGIPMTEPTTAEQPKFYDKHEGQTDKDPNVGLPVHGLDSISLTSHPNVDMDEANGGLYFLGPQKWFVDMGKDPAFQFGKCQIWDALWPNRLRPTPMTLEAATETFEKVLFDLYPGACPSIVQSAAKSTAITVSESARHLEAPEIATPVTQIPNGGFTISAPSVSPQRQLSETAQERNTMDILFPEFTQYSLQQLEYLVTDDSSVIDRTTQTEKPPKEYKTRVNGKKRQRLSSALSPIATEDTG